MKFANDIEELIYQEYQDIPYSAFQDRIRYFERNRSEITSLSYSLRLELSLEYVVALFEVGEYYQYLRHVDKLLARVIEDNIFSIDGDDIYQELLYRKAASLYNIVDYYAADKILRQLVRIDPDNEIYKRTFIKNSVDSLRYQGQRVRSVIITLFMVAAVVIGIELLSIRPFNPSHTTIVETIRNSILAVAVSGIMLQELRIRMRSWYRLKNIKN